MNITKAIELRTLTHPQKRIWYEEQMNPGTPVHVIGGTVFFGNGFDEQALKRSMERFITRTPGIRLRLAIMDGEAVQYISEEEAQIEVVHLTETLDVQDWIRQAAEEPFTLLDSPLYAFILFTSKRGVGFLFKSHHIITDGWSVQLVVNEVLSDYAALVEDEDQTASQVLEHSYTELIDKERKYLASPRFDRDRLFWIDQFKDLPEEQPFSKRGNKGERIRRPLSSAVSGTIRRFCEDNRISLNALFVGCLSLYLHKYYGLEDVVIGTPTMNRSGMKEKRIYGMYTGTMPLRVRVDRTMTVIDYLNKVQKDIQNGYLHQRYPYDLLAADLELARKGMEGLYQVCVNYYGTHLLSSAGQHDFTHEEFYNGYQNYALQLLIKEWSDDRQLVLELDYQVETVTSSQALELLDRIGLMIEQVCSRPSIEVRQLRITTPGEEQTVRNFNRTQAEFASDQSIIRLFEEQAARTPMAVAAEFEGLEMTYEALNRRANQLANFLLERGTASTGIIAIAVSHSIELLVSILGVLKAGAAYVPLDFNYPKERLRFILQDADVCVGITDDMEQVLPFSTVQWLDVTSRTFEESSSNNPVWQGEAEDLAYVIYTSGSTGTPKGVMIEHRALVNYISWARKVYLGKGQEAFALYSSLGFDLTVTSIFTPLVSGNRIVIYRDDGEGFLLDRISLEGKTHVLKLTPAHLSLMNRQALAGSPLVKLIVGGDDLKTSLAKEIVEASEGKMTLFNEYGPTEATVGCMIHRYDPNEDCGVSVPIGKPAENVQLYVLDSDLNQVPFGAEGELYIGGEGLARGYMNRPELTAERFIENAGFDRQRLYKTGDLVKLRSDQVLEYVGRTDFQVKINGFRIELKEVEGRFLEHQEINEVLVTSDCYLDGTACLSAYYVSEAEISLGELRSFLSERLPYYMIPAYMIRLTGIPLTLNGKPDKDRLPPPSLETSKTSVEQVSGLSEIEALMAALAGELLNVGSISMEDHFFHLGGDSIKAIQLVSRLNGLGYALRVRDLMRNPVLGHAASLVRKKDGGTGNSDSCSGDIRMSPIAEWFFDQQLPQPERYHQSVMLSASSDLDLGRLEKLLTAIVQHHDALRLNVRSQDRVMFYNDEHLHKPFRIQRFLLSGCDSQDQAEQERLIIDQIKSKMDLEKDMLFAACWFDTEGQDARLLLSAHHLIIDAQSWRIVLEDLFAGMHDDSYAVKSIELPDKTLSYGKWIDELSAYGERMPQSEKRYWLETSAKLESSPLTLHQKEHVSLGQSMTHKLSLTVEETRELLTTANRAFHTQAVELLLAAVVAAIAEFSGQTTVPLELEGHGREDLDALIGPPRTVGWFTSLFPVCFELDAREREQQIIAVKEQFRRIPNNGIGYGILTYLSRFLPRKKRQMIRFNYLGEFDSTFTSAHFKLQHGHSGIDTGERNAMTALIDLQAIVVDQVLEISAAYMSGIFEQEHIERLLNRIGRELREMIAYCTNRKTAAYTPSDFEAADLSMDDLKLLFEE